MESEDRTGETNPSAEWNGTPPMKPEEKLARATRWLNEGYIVRGCIYQARGDLDLALADLDNAVKLCPANIDAFIARARVRHEKGEHRLALEDIETALRLGKENCEAIYVCGLVFRRWINPLGMSSTP